MVLPIKLLNIVHISGHVVKTKTVIKLIAFSSSEIQLSHNHWILRIAALNVNNVLGQFSNIHDLYLNVNDLC